MPQSPKTLTVPKLTTPPIIDARWDKEPWSSIPSQTLSHYMGEKPQHIPETKFKVAYNSDAVYIIFNVKDRNVRALAKGYHSPVWEDSCVEFFFAPSGDISHGYFNVEINCGGTMLFNFQKEPRKNIALLPEAACDQVTIASTHPEIVHPEIKDGHEWTIEYRLPYSALEGYCDIVKPAPGVTWPANFYKCADMSSSPHWLTWSYVDDPTPNFHVPEYFGSIQFA